MRHNGYVKWLIILAVILSMLSAYLYAEVDESDMPTCLNYGVCEGSMI